MLFGRLLSRAMMRQLAQHETSVRDRERRGTNTVANDHRSIVLRGLGLLGTGTEMPADLDYSVRSHRTRIAWLSIAPDQRVEAIKAEYVKARRSRLHYAHYCLRR